MTGATGMTCWGSSLAYCRATLRIAMMTDAADAARLVVEQTTEHAAQKTAEYATMLTQAMTSITDVRICAAEKIVDNAAT